MKLQSSSTVSQPTISYGQFSSQSREEQLCFGMLVTVVTMCLVASLMGWSWPPRRSFGRNRAIISAPDLGGESQRLFGGAHLRLLEPAAGDLGAERQCREREDIADHLAYSPDTLFSVLSIDSARNLYAAWTVGGNGSGVTPSARQTLARRTKAPSSPAATASSPPPS